MKNKKYTVAILILAVIALIILSSFPVQAKKSNTRTTTGRYYDYMTIVTKDGHEWSLSDKQSKRNPYMRWDKIHKVYKGKFKNGQKVKDVIYTSKTKKKSVDRIISVRIAKVKHS
ncbi:hypothetical protein [Robinsoniella peoriensis]|uniref:hypothetical protein n=1 Tax=Robinsoniella peoriensis TaxID=180332 RepID=UPI0005C7DA72|nr:hypothetical protein [Robinsoniella peoriensis]